MKSEARDTLHVSRDTIFKNGRDKSYETRDNTSREEFLDAYKGMGHFSGVALLAPVCGSAGGRGRALRQGHPGGAFRRIDFAFMYYNQLDRDYPRSRHHEQILFAKGEYFYELPAYPEAGKLFSALLQEYPKSPAKLFALMYLYKIAEAGQGCPAAREFKKKF